MSPIWLDPSAVAPATVRRLSGDGPARDATVQRLAVSLVPAPRVAPQQVDPLGLRLMRLELENDRLRAELDQLRTSA